MNKRIFAAAFAFTAMMSAAPISIFNTGVDSSNALLTNPAADPHWTLQSSPLGSGSMYVVNEGNPVFDYWVANGPAAKWISPTTNAFDFVPPGSYVVRTTFDLSLFLPGTATFSGTYYADNQVTDVLINGNSLGISGGNFNNPTLFTLNCGSLCFAGVNTLDFVVANTATVATPMGLRVDISGTADLAPAPEPSAYIMMGAGIALLGAARFRKGTKK